MASDRPKITPNLSQIKTVAAWPFYHKVLDTIIELTKNPQIRHIKNKKNNNNKENLIFPTVVKSRI